MTPNMPKGPLFVRYTTGGLYRSFCIDKTKSKSYYIETYQARFLLPSAYGFQKGRWRSNNDIQMMKASHL